MRGTWSLRYNAAPHYSYNSSYLYELLSQGQAITKYTLVHEELIDSHAYA